jgi:hypothetical protein
MHRGQLTAEADDCGVESSVIHITDAKRAAS